MAAHLFYLPFNSAAALHLIIMHRLDAFLSPSPLRHDDKVSIRTTLQLCHIVIFGGEISLHRRRRRNCGRSTTTTDEEDGVAKSTRPTRRVGQKRQTKGLASRLSSSVQFTLFCPIFPSSPPPPPPVKEQVYNARNVAPQSAHHRSVPPRWLSGRGISAFARSPFRSFKSWIT